MRWWRRFVVAVLLTGIGLCLLPVWLAFRASNFAARHGCVLHEGFANPCVVDGIDHGERLYSNFVAGWLMLVTGPLALLLGVILLAILCLPTIVGWLRR